MNNIELKLSPKKQWITPDVLLISSAIKSGTQTNLHEANFTPNHTNYITPKGHIDSASAGVYPHFVS